MIVCVVGKLNDSLNSGNMPLKVLFLLHLRLIAVFSFDYFL